MPDLAALQNFAIYMLGTCCLLGIAVTAYVRITPHAELRLVREGNTAAAAALAGALLGLALPLASAVMHTSDFVEMAIWATIAVVAQSLVYLATRFLVPDLHAGLSNGVTAHGIVLGGLSVAIGFINAACIS